MKREREQRRNTYVGITTNNLCLIGEGLLAREWGESLECVVDVLLDPVGNTGVLQMLLYSLLAIKNK